MQLIAIVIFAAVVYFIYRRILKELHVRSLHKKAYLLTLLAGALPCTILIAILELSFDRFILAESACWWQDIFIAFCRAALLEEAMKYLFCRRAIRKHAPAGKAETMLLCGLVGAGYGLVEKLFYGGGVILIVNAFLPLHIFFQFLTGAFLYESAAAKQRGAADEAKRKGLLAILLPILVHGTWDSLLDVLGRLLEDEYSFGINALGLVGILVLIAGGLFAEIKVIQKTRLLANRETGMIADMSDRASE